MKQRKMEGGIETGSSCRERYFVAVKCKLKYDILGEILFVFSEKIKWYFRKCRKGDKL